MYPASREWTALRGVRAAAVLTDPISAILQSRLAVEWGLSVGRARSRSDSQMGGSLSSVGTSIATEHAQSIGSSIETLAVISVARTMPVMGARTTPVKKAAI